MKVFLLLFLVLPIFGTAQVSQVQVQTKFLQVNERWTKEIGITFGAGLSIGRIGSQDQFGTGIHAGIGVEIEPLNNLFISPMIQSFPFPSRNGDWNYRINNVGLSAPVVVAQDNHQVNLGIGVAPIITFALNEILTFNGDRQKHELGDNVNKLKAGVQLLPQVRLRTTSVDITIQGGATVMIGGLFKSHSGQSTNSVPMLGHIALIGKLFTNRKHQQSRTELIIFVTPQLADPAGHE